jgi:hypothetical protein
MLTTLLRQSLETIHATQTTAAQSHAVATVLPMELMHLVPQTTSQPPVFTKVLASVL